MFKFKTSNLIFTTHYLIKEKKIHYSKICIQSYAKTPGKQEQK